MYDPDIRNISNDRKAVLLMLQFFPTPYPDELWYNVLCRYHVRTGNATSAVTFRELFGGVDHAALGSFLPNRLINDIVKQLPEGIINVEDIALNHTLFKYIFRFQPLEVKQRLLDMTKDTKIDFPVKISKPSGMSELKSCPFCIREDAEQYGESYWHLSHQIPYVTVCHKHKCRLRSRQNLYKNELNNNFVSPDCSGGELDYNIPKSEIEFTEMLTRYLELSLEVGLTEGYSNLYEGLVNAGYGIARKDKNYTIDFGRISKDMCEKFGEGFIFEHFGSTKLTAAMFGQIRNWIRKFPERYAILAVFISQEPGVTFSQTRSENRIDKQFRELYESGLPYSKKYVCETLGVTERQLDIIAHNLRIEPFWRRRLRLEEKNNNLNLTLSSAERQTIEDYVEQYGFSSASGFLLYCMEQTVKGMEYGKA